MNQEGRNPDFTSQKTVVLVTFFDIKGIVHYEYLEEGQIINKESYFNIMRRVRESIRLKRNIRTILIWFVPVLAEPNHFLRYLYTITLRSEVIYQRLGDILGILSIATKCIVRTNYQTSCDKLGGQTWGENPGKRKKAAGPPPQKENHADHSGVKEEKVEPVERALTWGRFHAGQERLA
ncbi:hypothetical protein LAZ67_8000325 [Cordylochernes scorpioides]|uniref:Uncharacterized protein n=1 Tax=Cordylochernes scorpioides TaxID=51811 RepID=A0ABY6KQY0_9ARAC|nr:hypothetical protein LAZ67_8000325 [Cordylochernes scorpioides]